MYASAVLMNTKLAGPRLGPQIVSRTRLFPNLDAALGAKLTLLSAPAGFGKTTLAAEWLAQLASAVEAEEGDGAAARVRVLTAWLTLDEFDNDPAHFWSYVLAALEAAQGAPPGLRRWLGEMQRALAAARPPALEAVLAALVNEVAQLQAPLVLVLDDYQQIRTPAVHDGLHFFLAHLPPQVHVVMLTRTDPPLPLNRLRAQGELVELRAADLCFTHSEIDALLSRRLRVALPPESIAALAAQTDGWPAGLQLLALSVQGYSAREARRFIDSFTGSNRYIVDYLLEEVLARQPQPVREFLLRTALLDRFTVELCDELCQVDWNGDGGAFAADPTLTCRAILDLLETANLFVVSLDDSRVWYRYYQLFAEALQEELQRKSPGLAPLLHRRAGEWYARHHLYREAVEHLLAAGDWEGAAERLEEIAHPLLVAGEFGPLNRWLAALPPEVVEDRPRLALTRGWLLLFRGPLDQVEWHIEAAAAGLARAGSRARREGAYLYGELAALRAMLASFRWDAQATFALCAEAERLLPEGDEFLHGVVTHALGHAYQLHGDFTAAATTYQRSIAYCERLGSPQLAAFPTFRLGQAYLWQGRFEAAAETYRLGLKKAVGHGGVHWPITADGFIGLAEIARERNELSAAEDYVQRGLALAPGRSVEMVVLGLAAQAAIRLAAGRGEDARGLARQAVQRAREYNNARLLAWATAGLARVEIALGHLDSAVPWAEMAAARSGADEVLSELEAMTTARLYLAQGRPRAALALLEQVEARAAAGDRRRSVVETLVLQAAAHAVLQQEAEQDAAARALDRALALAEPEGMRRLFLDEGALLLPLLRRAAAASPFARELAELAEAGAAGGGTLQPDAPLDPLTPRELEILRLIARGASNRQIADTFVLTVGTVKGHVNHILSKLGAQNRTEAAARARAMGLI